MQKRNKFPMSVKLKISLNVWHVFVGGYFYETVDLGRNGINEIPRTSERHYCGPSQ